MKKKMNFLLSSITVFILSFSPANTFAQKLLVSGLKVEQLTNPLSVDNPRPRFSWILKAAQRNSMQASYEIQLGKTPDLKDQNIILLKKTDDQSVLIPYEGPALTSMTRYYWQVRIKDNHGNSSPWSAIQYFQTGLRAEDWTAKWITTSQIDTTLVSPLFRKEFAIAKKVKSAMIYLTAKGLYEAQINGKRLSNHYLSPGWTSYSDHIQYQVYDVTAQLQKGQNAIGVTLGDGWFKGRIGFDHQRMFYGDTRALLLQLEITYTDGTTQAVQTDESWKSNTGPVLASNIYDGETYDSRHELPGWTKPNYSNAAIWKPVRILGIGKERLIGMSGPPVTKHEEFNAIKIIKTPQGDTVVDFGQNLVGWVMLKAKGPAGTKITLSHAEVLDKAGNFYTENLRSAKQQNNYILKDETEQVFEPHFTFQGFRYVKIQGYPGGISLADLTAVAVYSDMAPTGTFTTSNTLLNQLQHNIQWGQKGNFVDVPTDCPQRDERLGWTGDAQAFGETAAYNMDVSGFFTKWLKDVKADQLPNGSVPFVVPNVLDAGSSGSAGWADVATIIPWDLYVAYGDKGILESQYESMKNWVGFISSKSKNDLWNTGFHFGDWLFYRPDDDNDGRAAVTDKYMIAQTFYAHSIQLLLSTAKVLGKTEDLNKYTELLDRVKAAYVKEYMTVSGKLVSNTQTAYVLALQFDMLPENLRKQAAGRLVENVKSYGNHLTTGFLGTPYLCHVLSRFGYENIAYDLLMQESYPSWLYPVKMGATTIWERWDGIKPDGSFQTPSMNSYNHYAYGAIGDWMYKNIAGINAVADQPGYKSILIAPKPGGGLTSASGELETVYGKVKSSWTISNGVFKFDVTVPANASATIVLPKSDKREQVGSGTYHFESKF